MTGRRRSPAQRQAAARAREAKLDRIHQQLEAGVAQLRNGDAWTSFLDFASRLHRYSFANTVLIFTQRPEATMVAGYRRWQELGRQVNRGEQGILILRPMTSTAPADEQHDEQPARDHAGADAPGSDRQQPKRRLVGFRPVSVFDISQTCGEPIPQPPQPELLAGQAPSGLWDALAGQIAAAGYTLNRVPPQTLHGANGITRLLDRAVEVRDDVDEAQAVKTLAHELAHVRLHGPDQPNSSREQREVEAESVAYLIMSSHGVAAEDYSFHYLAGWSSDQPALLAATGQRAIACARDILATIEAPAEADPLLAAADLPTSPEPGAHR